MNLAVTPKNPFCLTENHLQKPLIKKCVLEKTLLIKSIGGIERKAYSNRGIFKKVF